MVTRVDAKVDFSWSDTEAITPTGQDYISVRCGAVRCSLTLIVHKYFFWRPKAESAWGFIGSCTYLEKFVV